MDSWIQVTERDRGVCCVYLWLIHRPRQRRQQLRARLPGPRLQVFSKAAIEVETQTSCVFVSLRGPRGRDHPAVGLGETPVVRGAERGRNEKNFSCDPAQPWEINALELVISTGIFQDDENCALDDPSPGFLPGQMQIVRKRPRDKTPAGPCVFRE